MVWKEYDFLPYFVCIALSQFKVETTTDSAISLKMWCKSNPVTKNNKSATVAY